MNKDKKTTVQRRKEFGLYIMEGSLYAMASLEGEIEDDNLINERVLLVRDKLKRETLSHRVIVEGIRDAEEIDNIPPHKKIIMFLNPYYELEIVRNLEPFPVDMDNEENIKWINNIGAYLAMHLLYFKEFDKPLPSAREFHFTNRELIEAQEILFDYYDLENPERNLLEVDDRYIYYHPKKDLVRNAKKDIAEYETALVAKALVGREDATIEEIKADTGFDDQKIAFCLGQIVSRSEGDLAYKAKELIKE